MQRWGVLSGEWRKSACFTLYQSARHLSGYESMDVTASRTLLETKRFYHQWAIEKFESQIELKNVSDCIKSDPFPSANDDCAHKFCLIVFPNGSSESCSHHVSVFLHILSEFTHFVFITA